MMMMMLYCWALRNLWQLRFMFQTFWILLGGKLTMIWTWRRILSPVTSLRKQPTFAMPPLVSPPKWHLRKQCKKTHTGDPLGSPSDWLKQIPRVARPIRSTTRIWIVTSSVYNFCTCFSDVISRGNQWRRCEMSALLIKLKRTMFPQAVTSRESQ